MTDLEKLNKAQSLLSDIYHKYEKDSAISSIMSVADGCVIDTIALLEKKKTEKKPVLISHFIEYGYFEKDGGIGSSVDRFEMAIVYGDFEIIDLTPDEINELSGDWISLNEYKGEIVVSPA